MSNIQTLAGITMSIEFRDKVRGWIDDVKDKMFNVFGHDKTEKEEIYTKLDGCGIIPLLS